MTLSEHSRARPKRHSRRRATILGSALALGCALAWSCGGDPHGTYGLEKKFFEAEQAWSRARLQQESGQAPSITELRAQYESALADFDSLRPSLGIADSTLFVYAAGASQKISELLVSENQWDEVIRHQRRVASDTLFPLAARHRALFGWGEACEAQGQVRVACELYRQLAQSFFPPTTDGGVNAEVLRLPTRRATLAAASLPESLASFRAFGERYYDSLATQFPQTQMAFQALGELARLQGSAGRWEEALSTLERATDSLGQVFASYRIDRGEIQAGQLHDTASALGTFAQVAKDLSNTPFHVDADLKTAAIWFRRGRYADVQSLLQNTKRQVTSVPQVDLAVGPLLARSYAASGNRERARAEFSYLVTTHPRTLQALEAALAVAQLHSEMKDSAAVALWRARSDSLAFALATDPASSPPVVATAMNARASLAAETKQWDAVAMHLSTIAETFGPVSAPGASALIRLGWVQLLELKDTTSAARSWRVFLEALPEHPDGATLKNEMKKWPERYSSIPPS